MPRAEPPQTTSAMAIAKAPPPISRRTITAVANITTSIGSNGAIATAACSASRPPIKGPSTR